MIANTARTIGRPLAPGAWVLTCLLGLFAGGAGADTIITFDPAAP